MFGSELAIVKTFLSLQLFPTSRNAIFFMNTTNCSISRNFPACLCHGLSCAFVHVNPGAFYWICSWHCSDFDNLLRRTVKVSFPFDFNRKKLGFSRVAEFGLGCKNLASHILPNLFALTECLTHTRSSLPTLEFSMSFVGIINFENKHENNEISTTYVIRWVAV